ncbi:MAG: hypothetical protein QOI80_2591, partial [Solirubrobacteraceae bacterium]|nr:hypothetical protein [Solirubrobacteraceae bacterium]
MLHSVLGSEPPRRKRLLPAAVLVAGLAATLMTPAPAAAAHGRTWYVAKNGSDSRSGHKHAPFATIAHAAAVAHTGDTVLVRSGRYKES